MTINEYSVKLIATILFNIDKKIPYNENKCCTIEKKKFLVLIYILNLFQHKYNLLCIFTS